jgi:hypothetical protein
MNKQAKIAVLALVGIAGAGCTISTKFKLNVPFERQLEAGFCVPASIMMWRRYHGLPTGPSQYSIANALGTHWAHGTHPSRIEDGVRSYTLADDAYLDVSPSSMDARPEFFARQITSFDEREPVLAIVESGYHAGIVNGGGWSMTSDGYRQWDYVYFHDPDKTDGAPNKYWVSGDWIRYMCPNLYTTCSQVISASAVAAWQWNLYSVGDEIKVRGVRDWPPSL